MFWLSGPNFARKKRGVHGHTRVTRYRDQQTLSNVRHNLARLAWPVTTPASFCVRNVCGLVAWCSAIQIILIPFSIRRLQHRWYPTISACCRPAPLPSPNSIAIATDTREAWNRKRFATWTRSLSRVQAIFGLWILSASKALRSPSFHITSCFHSMIASGVSPGWRHSFLFLSHEAPSCVSTIALQCQMNLPLSWTNANPTVAAENLT